MLIHSFPVSLCVRRGPDISGSNMKVLHRTLDLLEAWLIDCKLVDWTLSSSILTTLENFLNAEVIVKLIINQKVQALK